MKSKTGTIAEWLEEHNDRDKYRSVEALVDACVVAKRTTRNTVTGVISRLRKRGVRIVRSERSSGAVVGDSKGEAGGLTKDQFRSRYDMEEAIRQAIRTALDSLKDERIVSDAEFRVDRCGAIGTQGWRQVSMSGEFLLYQFRCKGKTFWAAKSVVKWVLQNVSGTVAQA